MRNLSRKITLLLVVILSGFLLILLVIFNISLYDMEKAHLADMAVNGGYDPSLSERPHNIPPEHQDVDVFSDKIANEHLTMAFVLSLVVFVIVEMLIIYFSRIIARWITKPVEQTFAKQKQFISDASHELKTPLAIIQASVETLERKPHERKWLHNIQDETNKMNKLVTGLLELSRTDDLATKETYTSVDLSKLVRSTALSFESLMFENNLTLKTKVEPNIMFQCSNDKMRELLGVLLDNAIKYGSKKSTITVQLTKEHNEIILSVRNRGKAIPVAQRDRIFERFYRGDRSRNRKHSSYGLGLAIAKNIVENHNGSIKVECARGYTTFKVVFKN